MGISERLPLAIYYEHPDWFRPLFAELDRRGTPYVKLHASDHHYDPAGPAPRYALLFNRMSPSAFLRGHARAIFFTTQYLKHLRLKAVRVINGPRAWAFEISKAAQLALLADLSLPYPRARVVADPRAVPAAARDLRFPVVVKPNVGGSGAGVRRFETPAALAAAAAAGALDFGVDATGLVQEYIPPAADHIVRVEVMGGRYLYAIRVYTAGDDFNLCPADLCVNEAGTALEGAGCPTNARPGGLRVEAYTPPRDIVAAVERIITAAGIEIGGVEYVVDARDGRPYYYDVNALSNFVAGAPRVLGFDPFARLGDWLEQEAARALATSHRPRRGGRPMGVNAAPVRA